MISHNTLDEIIATAKRRNEFTTQIAEASTRSTTCITTSLARSYVKLHWMHVHKAILTA